MSDQQAQDAVETNPRGRRKVVVGVVKSDKMTKTITVESERLVRHPRFQKFVKRYSRYHAHDENETAKVGDTVELVECRPLSKLKHFRLLRVVRRAKGNVEDGGES